MSKNNVLKPIPDSFSIYLDLLRFGAAIFVLLFHMKNLQIGSPEILKLIPSRGHDFVILFFVLSGLVISATAERKKNLGFKQYIIERASRVYSVAIPAIIFSAVLALVFGDILNEYTRLILNILFLGQVGLNEYYPFWNQPFWSLCYEVMYYAIFGCFLFLKGYKRLFWVVFFLVLAGPKVLLLMPCWLFGVAIYFYRDKFKLDTKSALTVAFLLPIIFALFLNLVGFGEHVRAIIQEMLGNQYKAFAFSNYFIADYVTALIVSLHIYAMRYVHINWPAWLGNAIKTGASMSFTLYLMHLPIIFMIEKLIPREDRGVGVFIVTLLLIPIICWLISMITEQKRPQLTKLFTKVLN